MVSPKSVRSLGLMFVLFAIALMLRSWAMLFAVALTILVFWRFKLGQRKKASKPKMSEEEVDALIDEWEPEPLVPAYSAQQFGDPNFQPRTIEGRITKWVNTDGKQCLNLASNDFLSLIGNPQIEEVAKNAILKYGVGACGPRNFYGTVDVHLDLERQLAAFMDCEEAILYSYGFPTIASAIPAYAKRGDIIYADKGVHFAIQQGLEASRSQIVWFEHNDVEDLERRMLEQAQKDKKNPKKAAQVRRFIVVEGLYANSADLCPLPALVDLKWKYKARIFMDESYSFGVLGKSGKGVCEHYGVNVVDVDLIAASLENAMATTGGFCCGRSFVIGHQRLSGLGYCFSASLPPLLAVAASEALRITVREPERVDALRQNAIKLHRLIAKAIEGTHFELRGVEFAPHKHLGYACKGKDGREEAQRKLDALVEQLFNANVLVSRARYLEDKEAFPLEPSVKITCRSDLSAEEMEEIGTKLREAVQKVEEEN